jgi:hypothetical protein
MVVVVAAALAGACLAGPTEVARADCVRDKLSASRSAGMEIARCWVAWARSADATARDLCVDAAVARSATALERIDAVAVTPCDGDVETLAIGGPQAWLPALLGEVARDAPAPGACLDRRIRALSAYAARALRCRAATPGDAEEAAACAGKASLSAARAWNRATRRGDCQPVAAGTFLSAIDEAIDAQALVVSGQCPVGSERRDGHCRTVDECAAGLHACGDDSACVDLAQGYACAVECTQEAFEAALANCGGPAHAISFACRDTVIAIHGDGSAGREARCDGLVIDGADRNITFALEPACWARPTAPADCRFPLEDDGTCRCPESHSGTRFLHLSGDRNVVRDLEVQGFYDGVKVTGYENLVENVRFHRHCDEAFGNRQGAGNVFRSLLVTDGCGKCSQHYGDLELTDPDPSSPRHYNASIDDCEFRGCSQPVRTTHSGRWLVRRSSMSGTKADDFPCLGPRFSSGAGLTQIVHFVDNEVAGCDRGVRIGASVEALLAGNSIHDNAVRGVGAAADARVVLEGNTIVDNGGRASSEPGAGGISLTGTAQVDAGGGGLAVEGRPEGSAGGNTLCGNRAGDGLEREIDNLTGAEVAAERNLFCTRDPRPAMAGPVDVVPFRRARR